MIHFTSKMFCVATPLVFDPQDRLGHRNTTLSKCTSLLTEVVQPVAEAMLSAYEGKPIDAGLLDLYPIVRLGSRLCEAYYRLRNGVTPDLVGLYTGDEDYESFKVGVSSPIESLGNIAERVVPRAWNTAVAALECSVLQHLLDELGPCSQVQPIMMGIGSEELHEMNRRKAAAVMGLAEASDWKVLFPLLLKHRGLPGVAETCWKIRMCIGWPEKMQLWNEVFEESLRTGFVHEMYRMQQELEEISLRVAA